MKTKQEEKGSEARRKKERTCKKSESMIPSSTFRTVVIEWQMAQSKYCFKLQYFTTQYDFRLPFERIIEIE